MAAASLQKLVFSFIISHIFVSCHLPEKYKAVLLFAFSLNFALHAYFSSFKSNSTILVLLAS